VTTTVRDTVVLVDADGRPIGTAPKRTAHEPPGMLHLAFSVFLYRPDGALLLQQRAAGKYHFPGVWANACCSHPAPGEQVADGASARVREELGVEVALEVAGAFTYSAPCAISGLVEREFDWVFVGELDGSPDPDPAEVAALRFVTVDALRTGAVDGPLAPWLLPALELAESAREATAGKGTHTTP
jgi:isopentenyl-diphosphate delta-isomerase